MKLGKFGVKRYHDFMPGLPSSSNIKKFYQNYLLDALSLTVVRSLLSQKDALEGIAYLRQNIPDLVRAILPENKESRSIREIIKGTGEAIGSSLLLLSGIFRVGKLWIPGIGVLVGVHGLYRLVEGFGSYWEHRQTVDFLRVYLPSLKLMQEIDGCVTNQEVNHLDSLLVSFKLTKEEKGELTRVHVSKVDDLVIPEWFTRDHRILLLEGCYGMLYCDGLVPTEKEAFRKVAKKSGLLEAEINEVLQATQKDIDEQDDLFSAIGAIGWHLLSSAEFQQEKFLETLYRFSVKKETPKKLEQHFLKNYFFHGKMEREYLGKKKFLKKALACAFFLCRCRKPVAPETFADAEKLFLSLCKEYKLKDWAEQIRTEVDTFFEELLLQVLGEIGSI